MSVRRRAFSRNPYGRTIMWPGRAARPCHRERTRIMSDTPSTVPTLGAKLAAEGIGTFLLVFGGVGTALFVSNHYTDPGAGSGVQVAVALAFGLTAAVGAYAFGPVSGGHFHPAVTLGAAAAGRTPWKDVGPYMIAQVIGGAIGSTLLFLIGNFGPDGWLTGALDS